MTFDKWFNSQSRLLKVLLLILPVVGWIVECLIRLSVMLRTKSLVHIVIFLLLLLMGCKWLLCVRRRSYLSHHHGTSALCEIILIPPVGCPAGGIDLSRSLFSGERLFFTFRFPAFSVPVRGAPALSSLLLFPVFYISRPPCAPFLSCVLPILYNCRARQSKMGLLSRTAIISSKRYKSSGV